MEDYLLTTVDNPYDPFIQEDEWYSFDEQKGYHTCGYLARLCSISPEMTDEDIDRIYNEAAETIIRQNYGLYKKYYRKKK